MKAAIEKRLADMMMKNPLRTDFQKRYEDIVAEYNREKDRAVIEKTFEDLFSFTNGLDKEDHRAIREGLDEETLALFDLLIKPDLDKKEIDRIKKVCKELLTRLKAEKLRVDNWRAKEATRDAVLVEIRNFLYDDDTGLPDEIYTIVDLPEKVQQVYQHIYSQYQDAVHHVYAH